MARTVVDRMAINVSLELAERLRRYREATGITLTRIIRDSLQEYLDKRGFEVAKSEEV